MKKVPLSSELIREKALSRAEPEWLIEARLQAFATYEKLEAPRFLRTDLRATDVPALAATAFVHGGPARTAPVRQQEGVIAMPLADAAREHESVVRPIIGAGLDVAATKWDALEAALWNHGMFFHVEKNVEAADAISLSTEVPAEGGIMRDVVSMGALSKAHLVDRWTGGATDAPAATIAALDVHVADGAHLHLNLLQELSRTTTLLSTRRARIGRDAKLSWIDGQFGGEKCVVVNESILEAQGAKIDFIGAFFGSAGQHFDITTSALHRAKHTESQLAMKGALAANGYAANYSIVFIAENAPSSSGHQHQETLILGPGARADAIPKLDVENNDVSASHGATVGQVDPDQVFYLQSRGLDALGAKRVIVEGFFEPLLREIPFEDIRTEIGRALVARL